MTRSQSVTTPDQRVVFAADEPVLPESRRVADGPDPKFGDFPRWDLIAGGLAPNLAPYRAQLRFDDIPDDWRLTAKTLAMAMLQPTHSTLRAAGIYRSNRPRKLKTIQMTLAELKAFATWAAQQGMPNDLPQWTSADCKKYLTEVVHTRGRTAPFAARDLLKTLVTYGSVLPNGALDVELPAMEGRQSTTVKTPVIPPTTFWPLVRACWTYLSVFSEDILTARRQLDLLESLPRTGRAFRIGAQDSALDDWLNSPHAVIPLHIQDWGKGLRGQPNWIALSLKIFGRRSGAVFNGPYGMPRRRRVIDAMEHGLPTQLGVCDLQPKEVEQRDGTRGPWIEGFDHSTVCKEITQLRNAAYIFVGIMTMMRDSEIQGIASGSLRTHFGAPAIESMLHKGQQGAGRRELWWVSSPVIEALKIAEAIAINPDRLFGSVRNGTDRQLAGFDQHEQINGFVAWVNANTATTGLDPIPTTPLSPHMFRRTMAVITANEPDGEIALGITLKHNAVRALANVTTSGYGSPTPEWAKEFDHQGKEAAAGEIVADWANHARGEKSIRGPGARAFVNGLDAVSGLAYTAAVGNDRMLRNLLRDEFATIRLGTLNHCLGDPDRALCLDGASAAIRAGGPIPSMCQPSTCRNSVVTNKHLPVWLHEESDLVEKLKDKKMATVHRERLEAQLADVRKITRQEPK